MIVVISTATTVAVLVAALAVATGFTRASTRNGSSDRAIVLSGMNEVSSGIPRANLGAIMDAPGVAHMAAGAAIASADTLTSIAFTDARTDRDVYLPVRGVGTAALMLRPEVTLVAGRQFIPERHEVIVGRALAQRIGGLGVGSKIGFPDGDWSVVGIFSAQGGPQESEILTGAISLMNSLRLTGFNSVTVRLTGPSAFERFSSALTSTPGLSVKAFREDVYYAAISGPMSRLLKSIAYGLGLIMAFGATFGALNTMSSAVRARRTEIATLRAIGFGGTAIVTSVVIEALVLGFAGALLGALVAWSLLNGARISMMVAAGTPLHITFGLEVGGKILVVGALFALGIASAAAIFAAKQAARISIAAAIQDT